MKLILEEHAVDDFEWWAKNDLKILKKIADLLVQFSKILTKALESRKD